MDASPELHTSTRKLVQAKMDEFSNGERKVARALLAQYPTAGLTTVADLAASAGVSSPTVVRFVTRLGFAGFATFQRSLVHELNGELGSPLKQYAAKGPGSGDGVLATTEAAFAEMLRSSYDELPESEFTALVNLLTDPARDIRVTGGRFSKVVAEYLVLHLWLLRGGVELTRPEAMDRRRTVADAGVSTVALIFDYRRYSEESLQFARELAERGATICLMTDNWLSPIAKLAKVVLPVRVESPSPFDSLVAAIALAESLVAALAQKLDDSARQRLELIEGALDVE